METLLVAGDAADESLHPRYLGLHLSVAERVDFGDPVRAEPVFAPCAAVAQHPFGDLPPVVRLDLAAEVPGQSSPDTERELPRSADQVRVEQAFLAMLPWSAAGDLPPLFDGGNSLAW